MGARSPFCDHLLMLLMLLMLFLLLLLFQDPATTNAPLGPFHAAPLHGAIVAQGRGCPAHCHLAAACALPMAAAHHALAR